MADPTASDQKPTPDPTILTTEQLLREIGRLEKLLETQLLSMQLLIKAKVKGREHLTEAQFRAVSARLDLMERHRLELKTDIVAYQAQQKADTEKALAAAAVAAETAVNAALLAQKEAAAAQNESNTTAISLSAGQTKEQINKNAELSAAATKGLADKIEDDRAALAELRTLVLGLVAKTAGATETRTERRLDLGALVGVAGIIIAALAIVASIILATRR